MKQDIVFEEGQIDIIVEKMKKLSNEELNEAKIAAIATYLMNFYNGVENIIKRWAKEYSKRLPRKGSWHKELLNLSCSCNRGKVAIFSKDVVDKLYSYLIFRHFFVHGYGFKLDWEKMRSLVENIDNLWKQMKGQLSMFMDKIQ
jgi:uncharacterized protein YutE (UPF0331/DUF86 family)